MESKIVHKRLNDLSDPGARETLVCYLQYLMDYRRDVAGMDEYVASELHRLQSTKYVRQLVAGDPICDVLALAEDLDETDTQSSPRIWSGLRLKILSLK